ncbi:YycH family regulatory protein [Mammaliicoccus sp. Dog046]|uniref:YycH family regulatory protein n=1 Tax=Mammaliicoccus sp. Dog046 TaxID=3034233 RepID=UPI002B262FA8|nr:two-component system activity regulator YycH [Mammaliicoccus sp. Dog046]WQK85489.1 two-component system activity regulator YycH [Mammaliicoccus sp. Dog046]
MRNREVIKSIILFILVLISIFMTYRVWTFTPELTDLESDVNTDTPAIGPKISKPIDSVIMPFRMINRNGTDVKGTSNANDIKKITNQLLNKDVEKVDILSSASVVELADLSERYTILDFPDSVPSEMYLNQVLGLDMSTYPKINFNRILVDTKSSDKATVYLLSENKQKAIKLKTSMKSHEFDQMNKETAKDLKPYTGIITNEMTTSEINQIYVPEAADNMSVYRYVSNHISVSDLNDVILGDSVIARSKDNQVSTYNNNTGISSVNEDKQTYRYSNLSEDENRQKDISKGITNSFKFINEHAGFTDEFRLFDTDQKTGKVDYQMFLNNYPVFNDNHLASIEAVWGRDAINEYNRGLITTGVAVPSKKKADELPSSEEVRFALASNAEIDFSKVSNMAIGYDLSLPRDEIDNLQDTIEFTPKWYIKYDGEWKRYENGGLT